MYLKIVYLLPLIFNFCCVTKTTAQQNNASKEKIENLKLDTSLSSIPQSLKPDSQKAVRKDFRIEIYKSKNPPGKARLISTSANFYTYKLPMDNMPCLVPNSSLNDSINAMPCKYHHTGEPILNGKMPNTFPIQELIPKIIN